MKAVYCPYCGGRTKRNGRTSSGSQRWRCTACGASMPGGGALVQAHDVWESIDSREFDGTLESSHDEFDAGQLIAAFEGGAVLDSFNEDKRLEELLEGAVGQDGQFLPVAFMVATTTGFAKNSRLTFSVGQGSRKKYGWR